MTEILNIACDEAGHTGPDLLSQNQRYFGFASVAIGDIEAAELIDNARTTNTVQMPGLKASKLLRTERGRKIIAALLMSCEGRYAVNVYDKLLALCCQFFEYIYEPVFKDDPWLLYKKNMHRFVAMYAFLWMTDHESEARRAISEFQVYMRSRDPADAPFLFDNPRVPLSADGSREHPFESVLRFAYGYRDIIIADNAELGTQLPDSGRWTLDLSATSLWSHLNRWGREGKPLSVLCDSSRPLQAMAGKFTGDENDPGIVRTRQKGNTEQLGWKLVHPVEFVESKHHPAIQIADVIAGTAVATIAQTLPQGNEAIAESIARHGMAESILPDFDIVNPANREAAVNALILYGLATRAERYANPYESLPALYHAAEVAWARGDYNLTKSSTHK
jgi:Protein of unknown function (DUF3800)